MCVTASWDVKLCIGINARQITALKYKGGRLMRGKRIILISFCMLLSLSLIQIENASGASIIGSLPTGDQAFDVFVVGSYAYVANNTSGLMIIDVSNPQAPYLVGSINTPGQAWGVYVSGSYAYVADAAAGLQIVDISNPSNPAIIGTVDTPGEARRVWIYNSYAYIADSGGGLQVVDVSNPRAPSIIKSIPTPDGAHDVGVYGNYLYLCVYRNGIQIYDISSPRNPVLIGSVDTPYNAYGIGVSGSYAYVADADGDLQIINISNLSSPVIVSSASIPGQSVDVAVSGKYTFLVTNYQNYLSIVDISNPLIPNIAANVALPNGGLGVFVFGSIAYVAAHYGGLVIVDYSDLIQLPALQVIEPDGGEVLYKGTDYSIKWAWSNYTGNIRVHVFKDDTHYKTIAADIPVSNGTAGITFNPPANWASSDKYEIRISTIDNQAWDKSDGYFTITNTVNEQTFLWPVDPKNFTIGHYSACREWPRDSEGCYWLSDTSTAGAKIWRDVQPFLRHYFNEGYHLGADYNIGSGNQDRGKLVYSTSKGVITKVLENECGWGNIIFIRHDTSFGTYTSMYAHVDWINGTKPKKGLYVEGGIPIAEIGNGAWNSPKCSKEKKGSYPAHLHFEIREGEDTTPGPAYIKNINRKPPQGQIDPNAFISAHR